MQKKLDRFKRIVPSSGEMIVPYICMQKRGLPVIANYHTHTWRCSHANGTEEEYVRNAVKRGLKTLGFADHSPYCFPAEYCSGFRMKPEQLADYACVIGDLRQRYRSQLDIHLGVEMEYYPAYFADTLSLLRDHGVEYAILAQHFIGNERNEQPSGAPTEDESRLARYCRQLMDGMNTGLFTYLAHPDMFNFVGDPAVYRQHMRALCREANACGLPVEINLLGLGEGRHYPNPLFWEIAAEEGCRAILGCDAHRPEALLDVETEKRAHELANRLGVAIVETVPLRPIR